MVSDLECQITVFAIVIALLARLRGFEILTNDFTHIFSLCDQIVAKKLAFARLRPIERSTTLFAIENLEWGFARAGLKAVVVRELSIWKTILPLHAERDNTSSEHIFKNLVDMLDLPTCLRMESCAEANICAHGLQKRIPELGG